MSPATKTKIHDLEAHLKSLGSAVVAYSGGVDSAFLCVVAHRALGGRMVAVMGMSPSVAGREIEDAASVAARFGFPLERLPTHEMDNPLYVANAPDRCFHCKDELFGRLRDFAAARGFAWVLDGTNADDLADFRPGREAARGHGVQSPLAELGWSKGDIRQAGRELGIAVWDKPASPCLASRIPHGEPVRPALLKRVELAEVALRRLGFRDLRVRAHGELARIELPEQDLARLSDPDLRDAMVHKVRESGFRYVTVDLAGYRPGGSVWRRTNGPPSPDPWGDDRSDHGPETGSEEGGSRG